MTERAFREVFAQFLNGYWGAFHEALEAQSVTPRRLAGSLFDALQREHRTFEGLYTGPAKNALEGLGGVWHELTARRYQWPDPPLTHAEVTQALHLFEELYDSLIQQGESFPVVRKEILQQAVHGTPKDPLRADAAR